MIIGLVMIFLTIVAVFAADRVVRPLHQIAATIENVSAGYSDDVLHVDTFTETKSISEAINKMITIEGNITPKVAKIPPIMPFL